MSIVLITGLCKLLARLLKLLPGNRGSALPGLVATALDPNWVAKIVRENKLKSVIISGTNGKTTTAYLLGNVLKTGNVGFIRNSTGSNLMRGVASKLVEQVSLTGRLPVKLAIWEIDEAVVPQAVKQLKPQVVLITNLSRDQLDRYGELDTVLSRWQASFAKLPKNAQVIINAADPRLKALTWLRLSTFGKVNSKLGRQFPAHLEGKFNHDSLWATRALCQALKISKLPITDIARRLPPAFGRGESFTVAAKRYQLNLVKNPSSFNTNWQMLVNHKRLNQPLLIQLNDLLADGTDVSWIWDVNFSELSKRHLPVIVTGTRAFDMALRLKYAGLKSNLIKVTPNPVSAFNQLKRLPESRKYLLATYTAMRQLRRLLT